MKNNVSIFRVEHAVLKNELVYAGPYGVSGIVNSYEWDVCNRHSNNETHPPVDFDKKLNFCSKTMTNRFYCGFESIEQLKNWFNSRELNLLKSLDFVIREYKVPKKNIRFGDKQVVFIPTVKSSKESKEIL